MNGDPFEVDVAVEVERRLTRALAGRAETVSAGPAFTAADVTAVAKRSLRRRRRVTVTSVAMSVAVVTLAVFTSNLAGNPSTRLASPDPAGSATGASGGPGPNPSFAPPAGTVTAGSVGLSSWGDNQIARSDGTRVPVVLPPGWQMDRVTEVPDGWVFIAYNRGSAEQALYFLARDSADGPAIRIASMARASFGVSPDGRTVVAAGPTANSVVAYALPSFTPIRSSDVAVATVVVRAVSDDWALLTDATTRTQPTIASAWRWSSGDLLDARSEATMLGLGDDGLALRRVYPAHQGPLPLGCLDVLAVTGIVDGWPTGACADDLAAVSLSGQISPDGAWAVLNLNTLQPRAPVLVRTDDLRAETWRPTSLNTGAASRVWFWDSDETFVVSAVGELAGEPGRTPLGTFYRCHVTQGCRVLALPSGAPNPVQRRGPAR